MFVSNRRKLLPVVVLVSLLAGGTTFLLAQSGGPNLNASALNGLTSFQVDGTGTVVNGNLFPQSTVGTAKGSNIGIATYATSLGLAPDSLSSNGGAGNCARGAGTVVLTTPDGSQLTLGQAALNCTATTNGSNIIHNGGFIITGATGRFIGATGGGNVVTVFCSGTPGSLAHLHIDGTIQMH